MYRIITINGDAVASTLDEAKAKALELCPGGRLFFGASGGAVHNYASICADQGEPISFPEKTIGYIAFPECTWMNNGCNAVREMLASAAS